MRGSGPAGDQGKFLEALRGIDGSAVLFGGQCTLDPELFRKCLATGKIKSVSTNMIGWKPDICAALLEFRPEIATSWNPTRFSDGQYAEWKSRLAWAADAGFKVSVLVTADLWLADFGPADFIRLASSWECDQIAFQPYMPMDPALNGRMSDWLIAVDGMWADGMPSNRLRQEYLEDALFCECADGVRTIAPDGRVSKFCPMARGRSYGMPAECAGCGLAAKCRPCPLQPSCPVFMKYYRWLHGQA